MAHKSNRRSGPKGLSTGVGFFAMHPFEDVFFETDRYYNGIVKKVIPMLKPMEYYLDCNPSIIKRMALCIAAYFEDQVSQLGLWSAFVHRHRDLYGKWLPWYDTREDYYEDEVNLQDIKFLLWMINVSTEEDYYTAPDDSTIEECAEEIFDLLVEEFESAPVNESLLSLLRDDNITEDFYSMKNILRWMTKTCYLMAVPSWEMRERDNILKGIVKIIKDAGDDDKYSYFASSYECTRQRVGPLALYPNQWLVLIREQLGLSKDNDKILEMESTPLYPFIVVSDNGETIIMRSCRGVEYAVDKDSFQIDMARKLEYGTTVITSLVGYKGHWGVNGMAMLKGKSTTTEPLEKILSDLGKNLFKNGQPVDYFGIVDSDKKALPPVNEEKRKRLDKAVANNHHSRLFYFKDAYSLMLWEESMNDIEYGPKSRKEFLEYYDEDDKMMGFISENYAIIGMARAETINDPTNPHYNTEEAYLGGEFLYDKFGVPDVFAAYVVKHNCLAHLNFNIEEDDESNAKLLADNLPFWATFIRQYPC